MTVGKIWGCLAGALVLLLAGCERGAGDSPDCTAVTNRDGTVSVVGADGQRYLMMSPDKVK